MSRRPLTMPSTRSDEADETEAAGRAASSPSAEPAAARPGGVVASLTGTDVSTPVTVAQLPTPYDVAETVTAPLDDRERGHLPPLEAAALPSRAG
ncbi:hypothetical protein [Streptomyces albidoflavus]|uniref:hypothetical protein n=1 Tax=Streptomyces albidoflavus TaxID=1886 RepID=UPI003120164E